ncbi:MAG: hypothetical protein NVS4B3_20940 [Gemmatimonadaceae bacterium]
MFSPIWLIGQPGFPDPDLVILAPVLKTLIFGVVVAVIGSPIALAIGRRITRAGERQALAPEAAGRLERIEQGVEAIAVEVERISEAQRFAAKLMAERATPALHPPGDGGTR